MSDKPLDDKRLDEIKAWYLYYNWLITTDDLKQAFVDEHANNRGRAG